MNFSPSCVEIVASLTGKWLHEVLLPMLMEQQTVTNPAVIHHWFVCHDKTLNQQCMLAQACPQIMTNHLTICPPPQISHTLTLTLPHGLILLAQER